MPFDKSHLIDLDLLNYYDGLIASKEKDQDSTLNKYGDRISANEALLIKHGNRISTNENNIKNNFLSIDKRVTALENNNLALSSGDGSWSLVQKNTSLTNEASKESAIALGHFTKAINIRAIAAGVRTYASRINSFAIGEYNKRNDDAIFIVGGGNDQNSQINFFEIIKPLSTPLNSPDMKVTILGASIVNDNNFTDEWILDGGSAEDMVTLLAVENGDILVDNNEDQLATED